MGNSESSSKTKLVIIIISVVVILAVILAVLLGIYAWTSNSKKDVSTNEPQKVETVEKTKTGDYYFKDGKLVLEDAELVITDTKVIPVGEQGNVYGDKPVIAFWYEVTNLTGKEMTPATVWFAAFAAYQDNNPNTLNELEVGGMPDDRFLDTQFEKIKQGGTAKEAIAYELDDTTTDVILKATKGIGGEFLGEQVYKIK